MMAGFILPATAQTFSIGYTTECQYGFESEYMNWCNLLRTDLTLPLTKSSEFKLATIHFYKARNQRVIDDKLTFSNIEEDNMPGAIAIMGYQQILGKATLFAGIRNINEDYFIAPGMSVFTNSSCGIFPTLSCNYPIANYPVSGLCLNYNIAWSKIHIQGSLYSGKAYNGWTKNDNPFIVDIRKDGFFGLSEINYETNNGIFTMGIGLHNRLFLCDAYQQAIPEETPIEKTGETNEAKQLNATAWAYTEQTVWSNPKNELKVLAQFSQNSSKSAYCSQYWGIGSIWSYKTRKQQTFDTGVIYTRGKLDNAFESDTEITCRYTFRTDAYIQSALHLIQNQESLRAVLLIRFSYLLSW